MKGFEAGANLYLVKPSSPEMMIENIRMITAMLKPGGEEESGALHDR